MRWKQGSWPQTGHVAKNARTSMNSSPTVSNSFARSRTAKTTISPPGSVKRVTQVTNSPKTENDVYFEANSKIVK